MGFHDQKKSRPVPLSFLLEMRMVLNDIWNFNLQIYACAQEAVPEMTIIVLLQNIICQQIL